MSVPLLVPLKPSANIRFLELLYVLSPAGFGPQVLRIMDKGRLQANSINITQLSQGR